MPVRNKLVASAYHRAHWCNGLALGIRAKHAKPCFLLWLKIPSAFLPCVEQMTVIQSMGDEGIDRQAHFQEQRR